VHNQVTDQPSPTLVCELAPVLIYTRFSWVRSYDTFLAEATIEQLHALRIEFKKFRYTVEYFREVLGKTAQDVIADIKKVQDHLGDLNDAQVATQILREFIDEWESRLETLPIHERPNLEPLIQYLAARHAERRQLMLSFPKTWKYLNRSGFQRNLAQAVATL
jgi:CHAD domain-containing protein